MTTAYIHLRIDIIIHSLVFVSSGGCWLQRDNLQS